MSILDCWWIEGQAEGATGWAIGDESEPESDTPGEVASLYDQLELTLQLLADEWHAPDALPPNVIPFRRRVTR